MHLIETFFDIPNSRSSYQVKTPRGGGVGDRRGFLWGKLLVGAARPAGLANVFGVAWLTLLRRLLRGEKVIKPTVPMPTSKQPGAMAAMFG